MSLVADYGSDSDGSESSSDSEKDVIKTELKTEQEDIKFPQPTFKLPIPNFDGKSKMVATDLQTSVFTNPFLEAEHAKEAILQKHVKMVNTKDVVIINGKKICWNYRKGRCRFGHNCKYAHDSDIQKTKEQLDMEKDVAKVQSVVCSSGVTGFSGLQQPTAQDIDKIKEESLLDKKKRKRPGLTQGLMPGKKVMKQYHNTKS